MVTKQGSNTLLKQKIMGIVLIIMTVAIFMVARTGTTPMDQDCTFALITGPLGLYLLVTKNIIIVD